MKIHSVLLAVSLKPCLYFPSSVICNQLAGPFKAFGGLPILTSDTTLVQLSVVSGDKGDGYCHQQILHIKCSKNYEISLICHNSVKAFMKSMLKIQCCEHFSTTFWHVTSSSRNDLAWYNNFIKSHVIGWTLPWKRPQRGWKFVLICRFTNLCELKLIQSSK